MDLRLPLGLLFATIGALLAGFGAMTIGADMYVERSLGVNVNLWAGLAMLATGGVILALARRGAQRGRTSPSR